MLIVKFVVLTDFFITGRDVRPKMTWATFGRINLLAFYA